MRANITCEAKPYALVVDDDHLSRILVRELLEQAGFVVEEAVNGIQALESMGNKIPDIIILDVMMPVLDGYSTCTEIRRLAAGNMVPVLMMTGLDDIESVQKAYDCGATDFISKPINLLVMKYRVLYILRANKTLHKLKLSETRLAEAQRIAKIGTWEMNISTGEVIWSDEVYRILGMEPIVSNTLLDTVPYAGQLIELQKVAEQIRKGFADKKSFFLESHIIKSDGSVCLFNIEGGTTGEGESGPVLVIGYIQDITEQKKAEEQIRYLAYFDSLTGLPNRTLFNDNFNRALSLSRRINSKLAILFIDLDRFKNINDTLGHSVGDELLKQVAERLVSCVRGYDSITRNNSDEKEMKVARFAGDEFLILLDNIHDHVEVAKIAQRISSEISEPYAINDRDISITASIGISLYPIDGENMEEMLKNSDIAMYHAKNSGRNNFQFYLKTINESAMTHLVMESELRNALKREELSVLYQPIIDISAGEITSVEALLRWKSNELGDVQPAIFIPLAEESGIIAELDSWMMYTACLQIKKWQKVLPNLKLSVNISGYHFKKKNVLEIIDRVSNISDIDQSNLEIELSEAILMDPNPYTITTLNNLKKRGSTILLDDFGTGYSSLSYLKSFPIDIVKVDKSFVKGIITDPDSASLTSAIIAMSRSLKLDIIAEGVENREQMNFLFNNGCNKMQGYWFSHPLSAKEFDSFIKSYKVPKL